MMNMRYIGKINPYISNAPYRIPQQGSAQKKTAIDENAAPHISSNAAYRNVSPLHHEASSLLWRNLSPKNAAQALSYAHLSKGDLYAQNLGKNINIYA